MTSGDPATGSLRLDAVAYEVPDPVAAAAFWAGLLDRDVVHGAGTHSVPGSATQVGLRFVGPGAEVVGRPRLHLHLTSTSPEDQARVVATALRLGGRHLDVGQDADAGFVVMADPGGNELCVIEPGDTYLAGTGRLGEVTCDGSRAAALFWRDALDWSVVWDEGPQVALQSPLGGTKIGWDAWDAPRDGRARGGRRPWFELRAADPAREAERLVSLGATRPEVRPDGVALADPDGTGFVILARDALAR